MALINLHFRFNRCVFSYGIVACLREFSCSLSLSLCLSLSFSIFTSFYESLSGPALFASTRWRLNGYVCAQRNVLTILYTSESLLLYTRVALIKFSAFSRNQCSSGVNTAREIYTVLNFIPSLYFLSKYFFFFLFNWSLFLLSSFSSSPQEN